jgi:hypothetical protein
MKEHYKIHGNKHQDCNFGMIKFNLKKKGRDFSAEEAGDRNRPSKGKKTTSTTTTTTTESTSSTSSSTTLSPSGTGVIYLDFTGHTVTGTSWNYTGDIVCTPANLSSTQVDEILASVIEDFSPFDVIITIDEGEYLSAPRYRKTRVVLTETYEWYGQAGGVAFVGSFSWGDNTPCFVFTSLLNYSTKRIREAASHEIGHTLGLYHQASYDANCIKTSEYNRGGCPISCGEAPIMGVAYYEPVGRWWIGPNSYGCNNIQNDINILKTVIPLK